MKKFFSVLLFGSLLLVSKQVYAQLDVGLPIDFEMSDNLLQIDSSYFVDFNGGTVSVLENPYQININTSKYVGKIVRDGGDVWAGSKIQLDENLVFNEYPFISMKVFTDAPIGTLIRLKIEDPLYIDLGDPSFEVDVWTTTTGDWETLVFDFSDSPPTYNNIAFMFDYTNIGDGTIQSTFYFDDIVQTASADQEVISGCTYIIACNYNPDATLDDGSCFFSELYYDCNGFCINDADNDDICDEIDNCILVSNFEQIDSDNDGEGDLCDYDDGLGLTNLEESSCTVIKMIDVLGREVKVHTDGMLLFNIYSDGRIEKVFKK